MIYDILEQLASDNSRDFKIDLLGRHKDNDVLKQVIFLALDPFTSFYIKKIPPIDCNRPTTLTLADALSSLQELSSRKVTGNAAIAFLTSLLNSLDFDDADVITRIIKKDLRCGVSDATVNKVWPGLINVYGVCLAHQDISHIKYPAYCQIKYDGGLTHLHFDGDVTTAYTRSGKVVELFGAFDEAAKQLMQPGEIWVGETVFYADGLMMDRKTSNGLFNKGVKQTISQAEAMQAVFHAWDIVDYSGTVPYESRFSTLEQRFTSTDHNIQLVENNIVNNEEQALELYNQFLNRGYEGAVLKNKDFKWEPKRVKGQGKLKACESADLVITGITEGTGKYQGRLGAITCQTACGKLAVSVGTGFTDAERQALYTQDIVGKIVTVEYNQKITDKRKSTASLFLPRFIEIREDKITANTLEELK